MLYTELEVSVVQMICLDPKVPVRYGVLGPASDQKVRSIYGNLESGLGVSSMQDPMLCSSKCKDCLCKRTDGQRDG